MIIYTGENFVLRARLRKNTLWEFILHAKKKISFPSNVIFNKFSFFLRLYFLKDIDFQYKHLRTQKEFHYRSFISKEKLKLFSEIEYYPLKIVQSINFMNKPLLKYAKFSDLVMVNELKDYTEVFISFAIKEKFQWESLDLNGRW